MKVKENGEKEKETASTRVENETRGWPLTGELIPEGIFSKLIAFLLHVSQNLAHVGRVQLAVPDDANEHVLMGCSVPSHHCTTHDGSTREEGEFER